MVTSQRTIQVMLVDDSAVVRGLLQRALANEPVITIAATATDGQSAIDTLKKTPVDIIVLDIEMPRMDGITALPELLRIAPGVKIIMASSLTQRNAEISLRALELGAVDYLAKPSSLTQTAGAEYFSQLITKIRALMPVERPPVTMPVTNTIPLNFRAQALAIASSTGGPQALVTIFTAMKGKLAQVPVFITQHMPPNFTAILAEHISKAWGGDCHEAIHGEAVRPGVIYLAPGDFHMTVEKQGTEIVVKLDKNPPENFCRPAADPMLRSLSHVYREKLLTAVLTGMGSDGAKGAAAVTAAGGLVVAQDAASCVVYGMPKAVIDAKLAHAILPLDQVAPCLMKAVGGI